MPLWMVKDQESVKCCPLHLQQKLFVHQRWEKESLLIHLPGNVQSATCSPSRFFVNRLSIICFVLCGAWQFPEAAEYGVQQSHPEIQCSLTSDSFWLWRLSEQAHKWTHKSGPYTRKILNSLLIFPAAVPCLLSLFVFRDSYRRTLKSCLIIYFCLSKSEFLPHSTSSTIPIDIYWIF